jgi:serine/threonine-protein kinase RsbW
MPATGERALNLLVVRADLSVLGDVRAWIRLRAEPGEFSERDLADLELAVTEAVSNVIRHAYGQNADHHISIHAGLEAGRFVVSIRDAGAPFFGVPAESGPPSPRGGGYGLGLISTLMDDATWHRLPDGHNELRLVRMCPGPPA